MADTELDLSEQLLHALAAWDPIGVLDRDPTREGAARLHRGVVEARRVLALAEDALAEFLFDVCGTGRLELDGVGVCEVRVGKDRKTWRHDEVVRDLVPAIVAVVFGDDDVELVRADEGTKVTARFVADAILARYRECSSDGWKVTGLRAAGLDPDDYCTTSRGRVSVQWS